MSERMTYMERLLLQDMGQALRRQVLFRRIVIWIRGRGLTTSDVLLASYPKSGSTWMRFILASMLGHDADFDDIRSVIPPVGAHRDAAAALLPSSGRIVRTHEQAHRFTSQPPRRALLLVRDGRDVAVSFYFHLQRVGQFRGSFAEFLHRFLRGRVGVYGSWMDHCQSWLEAKGATSVHVIRYEDLLRLGPDALLPVVDFLGMDIPWRAIIRAYDRNSRDRMREFEQQSSRFGSKEERRTIPLVRAAIAGSWRDHFSAQQERDFHAVAGALQHKLGYS